MHSELGQGAPFATCAEPLMSDGAQALVQQEAEIGRRLMSR